MENLSVCTEKKKLEQWEGKVSLTQTQTFKKRGDAEEAGTQCEQFQHIYHLKEKKLQTKDKHPAKQTSWLSFFNTFLLAKAMITNNMVQKTNKR